MSILIKGMEMPKGCSCCDLNRGRTRGFAACAAIGRAARYSELAEGKLVGCPLVPVPPDGRLIDADVVARDLQEMSEDIEKSFPYLDKNDALMIERGIQFARQYVFNLAPTIIEAEVDDDNK